MKVRDDYIINSNEEVNLKHALAQVSKISYRTLTEVMEEDGLELNEIEYQLNIMFKDMGGIS